MFVLQRSCRLLTPPCLRQRRTFLPSACTFAAVPAPSHRWEAVPEHIFTFYLLRSLNGRRVAFVLRARRGAG